MSHFVSAEVAKKFLVNCPAQHPGGCSCDGCAARLAEAINEPIKAAAEECTHWSSQVVELEKSNAELALQLFEMAAERDRQLARADEYAEKLAGMVEVPVA